MSYLPTAALSAAVSGVCAWLAAVEEEWSRLFSLLQPGILPLPDTREASQEDKVITGPFWSLCVEGPAGLTGISCWALFSDSANQSQTLEEPQSAC